MSKRQNSLINGLMVAVLSVIINTIFVGFDDVNFREAFIMFVAIFLVYSVVHYFFLDKNRVEN
ncbi:MAG: hypothetical protein NUV80_03410 [Candidatus Berkelbacteria bacterium]|nr:hypothetical protein [Candidatus Berkelbacteria bacterium]MCR4307583.1 hypothetical protein [Candidatus Berkelbacteria bacterium]